MRLFKSFCGILVFTLFGSFVRTADDVVISFPSSLQLSLPVRNNAKYTVHLSREEVDAIDAHVLEDVNGSQWHMKKLELVRNYGNVEDSASFMVAKIVENGVLKTKYVGDFVHAKESYSMFPNTLEHKLDRKETLEEHSVVLDGVEYVVALMKPLPTRMNDVVPKPPADTVYMNGQKISNAEVPEDLDRSKRYDSGVTDLVAEVLFIIDHSVYRKFLYFNRQNKDETIQMLRHYFAHIAHGIDQVYQSINTTKYRFSIKLAGYFICETPADSSFIEQSKVDATTFNSQAALNNFAKWNYERVVSNQNSKNNFPKYDLAVTFTNYYSGGVLGVAYLGVACTINSVGVVIDRGQQDTIQVAAHEIGHILGAPHDEEEGNSCPARDRYIMTAIYDLVDKNNRHTFSSCSREYFQNYAYKLDSIGQNCMLKSRTNSNNEDSMKHVKVLLGTKYSLDLQCQMIYGPNSTSCLPKGTTNSSQNSCGKLYCHLRNNGCINARRKILPGTPCGDKMWCLNEKCVSNSIKPDFKENKTTRKPDNSEPSTKPPKNWCIRDLNVQLCINILKDEKSRKDQCNEFLYDCCKTCAPYVSDNQATTRRPDTSAPNRNTNPPCTQDKHAQWCKDSLKDDKSRKAYCKDYIDSCCKTCAPFVSG